MFVDKVILKLEAGKGGNGVVAWRREKYLPKGGPTGGNGGRGADVIIVVDTQVLSLEGFRNKRLMRAENGRAGGPSRQQGRRGKDLVLRVPCGTVVKDSVTGEVLYDLTQDGEKVVLCRGGRGGRGNESFKTPTNRAPNYCTEGKPGEDIEVELELKLIADVGLLGFPNGGKSTIITKLANVRVKIAPYPFTTLRPNIGYIECEDYSRILIADIPGIICGAHQNKGLGFEFLRHIERTKMLVYVIDVAGIDGRDPYEDFETLRNELANYNEEMLDRPFIIVLNKTDIEGASDNVAEFRNKCPFPNNILEVSALSGEGIADLKHNVQNLGKTLCSSLN